MDSMIKTIGKAVKEVAKNRGSEWWYTPHMAAASRAIAERIPLVDLLLEVRDARIPISSEYEQLRDFAPTSKRVIVLNKMDLADRSQTKGWIKFLEEQNHRTIAVNSHNRDSIKELLNFLQARVRELKRMDDNDHTVTLMMVGIPNGGKSALANSLHQVGRISSAEKGKLKHSTVSPNPGETKDISSLKIASRPNIYVLDTPGILPPRLNDDSICAKLALTGALKNSVVGETEIARYFLSILSSSDEYKKWSRIPSVRSSHTSSEEADKTRKRLYPTDHSQDSVVKNARHALCGKILGFKGCIENEKDFAGLLDELFEVLLGVFHLGCESEDSNQRIVAKKLLDLCRSGRLGCYTLDHIPLYN